MTDGTIEELAAEDRFPVELPGLRGRCWTSWREREAIAELIPPGGRVLEIGTASGVTAAWLADAAQPSLLVCVDNFADADDPAVAESDPDRIANWQANARPCMRLWLGDFGPLAAFSVPEWFDVSFVDADHTLPGVLSDLILASRLTKPEGWLLAHDYRDPSWPDVTRAVDHFCDAFGWRLDKTVGSVAFLRRA